MGVAASSLHVASVTPSSSERGLCTVLPCCNVVSLPQETVLHELILPVYVLCTGCGPPRDRLLQRGLHWVMAFLWCSHLLCCGVILWLQMGFCPSVGLWGLHGLSLPSHHGLKESLLWRIRCPPSPLPPYLSFSLPTPLQNKRTYPKGFFSSLICYCRKADWLSLEQRRVWLGAGELLKGAAPVASSPAAKAPPDENPVHHVIWPLHTT